MHHAQVNMNNKYRWDLLNLPYKQPYCLWEQQTEMTLPIILYLNLCIRYYKIIDINVFLILIRYQYMLYAELFCVKQKVGGPNELK